VTNAKMHPVLAVLVRALMMFGASMILYSASYPLLGDDFVRRSSPSFWGTLLLALTRYMICSIAWTLGLDRKPSPAADQHKAKNSPLRDLRIQHGP
jgi:hypothetical protein